MDLFQQIDEAEACVQRLESTIQALLPEDRRFERLRRDAHGLITKYPQPDARPPLFGVLVGVKDIFHVDGWTTRAGSRLPPEVLQGPEAESVRRLKAAGVLLLGKTVTTEFAHFMPGPTRNPHNPDHTPGGSSSGSAAAVAAGFCQLALGSQTIGSIIRPASFCGIIGLKPTFGRIPTDGVIPLAPSLDHVGCFAADLDILTRAARVMYTTWDDSSVAAGAPVLGVPEGPYLERASADTMAWFDGVCRGLREGGFMCRPVPVMADYAEIHERQQVIVAAEAARVHAAWFDQYEELYGSKTADLIRRGRSITSTQLAAALDARDAFRDELRGRMRDAGIDAWICPSATGPAPRGLESTGDPVMSLPWTQVGFPAINLPAGTAANRFDWLRACGLPLGLQVVGEWQRDEELVLYARALHRVTSEL
jgi:Asp-tRNA(Asn)/Glu-tRNA(Gln) amidotransferase A subunit family amidase